MNSRYGRYAARIYSAPAKDGEPIANFGVVTLRGNDKLKLLKAAKDLAISKRIVRPVVEIELYDGQTLDTFKYYQAKKTNCWGWYKPSSNMEQREGA